MIFLKKLLSIALLIAAPIISGKAFYEYVNIKFLEHKPSYPFGKELMDNLRVTDISYLANYEKELLTIGFVFLGISVVAYIGMVIKALLNLVWLAAAVGVGYYITHFM
ncbi:MAG: hypothetical protein SGJ00_05655 [bacterium]|nr:hypothetical protein [bacterium]